MNTPKGLTFVNSIFNVGIPVSLDSHNSHTGGKVKRILESDRTTEKIDLEDFMVQFFLDEDSMKKEGGEFLKGLEGAILENLGDAYKGRTLYLFAQMLIETGVVTNRQINFVQKNPSRWKELFIKYHENLEKEKKKSSPK